MGVGTVLYVRLVSFLVLLLLVSQTVHKEFVCYWELAHGPPSASQPEAEDSP